MESKNINGRRNLCIVFFGTIILFLLLAGSEGAAQKQTWIVNQNGVMAEIAYGSGTNYPQYAALNTSSCYFRMVAPDTNWGSSIILCPSFWENGVNKQGYPVSYTWNVDGSDVVFTLNGKISNQTANISIRIHPPSNNTISANVEANVIGNIQLDNRPGEAFKPVMVSSMHISTDQWDASSAYAGAMIFTIPSEGWIVWPPVNSDVLGLKGGTSNWKVNSPTVEIHLNNSYQVTGWVTKSSNPNSDNIGFWAASNNFVRTWGYTIVVRNENPPTPTPTPTPNIMEYYRQYGGNPNVITTKGLLKAADDWSRNITPPGFTVPITTQRLLTLADEWSRS
jgi:hypothetical protein